MYIFGNDVRRHTHMHALSIFTHVIQFGQKYPYYHQNRISSGNTCIIAVRCKVIADLILVPDLLIHGTLPQQHQTLSYHEV